MSASPIFRGLFAVASALMVSLSSAVAGGAGIDDKGEFFSGSAKAAARRQISQLQRELKRDLAIETFKAIPAEEGSAANFADKAALNRLMEQWAVKQARAKGVNGVYALLVKVPPHLQVVVGNETQKKAFTLRDRDALVSLMLAKLRAKDNDGALSEGVNFVASTMRAHAGGSTGSGVNLERPDAGARAQSSWSWVVPLVVVLLGVWVVVGLFRALFRGGGSVMAPGMGGGGGFMSSLMGGLFGAAAGMWMYDHFLGHGSSAYGAEPGHDPGSPGFSGQDTDYSGSGGSFGDDSGGGGGDSGGGGFGGGDSGGGDF
jgi:hypothetical protein